MLVGCGLSAQQALTPRTSTNVTQVMPQSESVSEAIDTTVNSPMDVDQQGSSYLR